LISNEFTDGNYRPLLSSIKSEYTRFMAHYEDELVQISPQLQRAKELLAQKDVMAEQTQRGCVAERKKLGQQLVDVEEERWEAEQETLQAAEDLIESKTDLKTSQYDIEHMHEVNVTLVESIQRYEGQLTAQMAQEEEETRNMHKYRAQLEELLAKYKAGLLTQGGQGGRPAPLPCRFLRIPTRFLLNLHEI
jgi:hypothetical protein